MINRENYLDVKKYLDYQKNIIQNDDKTIAVLWQRLRHLIEWADGTKFASAGKIKPSFPAYLAGLKNEDDEPSIGTAHFASCCKTARAFFTWEKTANPRTYKDIDLNWIKTIRPPKARSEQSEVKTRELYTVEEVIQMATCKVNTPMLRRTQAAAAFLFLSGMRIGAFVSLPINCVDLENLTVSQLPAKGVMTKNHKAAITTLLDIPELINVVRSWDAFLRSRVPDHILWFVPFDHNLEPAMENPKMSRIKTRKDNFRRDLLQLCEVAGVKYKSAHKFRNGNAVYGLKRSKNMGHFKAVSQNLMHANMGITDGIYGNLVGSEVHDVITSLSKVELTKDSDKETLTKVIEFLQTQIKPKPTAG